jgi:predicted molibdopterin-dependent oxidoreductase YjgC
LAYPFAVFSPSVIRLLMRFDSSPGVAPVASANTVARARSLTAERLASADMSIVVGAASAGSTRVASTRTSRERRQSKDKVGMAFPSGFDIE